MIDEAELMAAVMSGYIPTPVEDLMGEFYCPEGVTPCWADRPAAFCPDTLVACDKAGHGRLGLCYEHEKAILGYVKDRIGEDVA